MLSLLDDTTSPLKTFRMEWELREVEKNKCHVKFTLTYDFKSAIQKMFAGATFDKMQKEIIPSFEKRCNSISSEREWKY